MPHINNAAKEIEYKIVYVGPSVAGKTTNVNFVSEAVPKELRGKVLSMETEGERTLLFDYMPLNVGTVNGFKVKVRLFTVPGQVYYEYVQSVILKKADGIVFVADSNPNRMEANEISMFNLYRMMEKERKPILPTFPLIIQYNKRDHPLAVSVDDLNALLNPTEFPTVEAIAKDGKNVFETLTLITKLVMESDQA